MLFVSITDDANDVILLLHCLLWCTWLDSGGDLLSKQEETGCHPIPKRGSWENALWVKLVFERGKYVSRRMVERVRI